MTEMRDAPVRKAMVRPAMPRARGAASGPGGTLRVSLVHPGELGAAELRAWREMQRATPALASPYLAPEFTIAMGRQRDNVRVAVLSDGAGFVGFLPLERYAAGMGKAVGSGMALSGRQGLIHVPGLEWEPRAVLKACGLAVWEFNHLIAEQRPFRPYQAIHGTAAVVDLSAGFDAYLAELSQEAPKLVRNARRYERKLGQDVGAVRFELDTQDDRALDMLLAWKSKQYERTGRSNPLAKRWIRGLIDDLVRARADGFAGVLSMLYADGEPLAGCISLRFDRTLAGWFTAYDPRLGKYSPGTVQFMRYIEAAAAAGIECIDLGPGEKEYKNRFKNRDARIAGGWVTRPTPAAAMHVARRAPMAFGRDAVLRHPRLLTSADRLLKRYGRLRLGLNSLAGG